MIALVVIVKSTIEDFSSIFLFGEKCRLRVVVSCAQSHCESVTEPLMDLSLSSALVPLQGTAKATLAFTGPLDESGAWN